MLQKKEQQQIHTHFLCLWWIIHDYMISILTCMCMYVHEIHVKVSNGHYKETFWMKILQAKCDHLCRILSSDAIYMSYITVNCFFLNIYFIIYWNFSNVKTSGIYIHVYLALLCWVWQACLYQVPNMLHFWDMYCYKLTLVQKRIIQMCEYKDHESYLCLYHVPTLNHLCYLDDESWRKNCVIKLSTSSFHSESFESITMVPAWPGTCPVRLGCDLWGGHKGICHIQSDRWSLRSAVTM